MVDRWNDNKVERVEIGIGESRKVWDGYGMEEWKEGLG